MSHDPQAPAAGALASPEVPPSEVEAVTSRHPAPPEAPAHGAREEWTLPETRAGRPNTGARQGMDREIKERIEDIKQGTSTKVRSAAGEVTQGLEAQANQQKGVAADQLDGIAKALHDSGRAFEDCDQPNLAGYIHRAADGLSGFANNLQRGDVRELVGRTESYARRHPEVFIAGSFLAGFLVTRFLQTSRREEGGGRGWSEGGGSELRGPDDWPSSGDSLRPSEGSLLGPESLEGGSGGGTLARAEGQIGGGGIRESELAAGGEDAFPVSPSFGGALPEGANRESYTGSDVQRPQGGIGTRPGGE